MLVAALIANLSTRAIWTPLVHATWALTQESSKWVKIFYTQQQIYLFVYYIYIYFFFLANVDKFSNGLRSLLNNCLSC